MGLRLTPFLFLSPTFFRRQLFPPLDDAPKSHFSRKYGKLQRFRSSSVEANKNSSLRVDCSQVKAEDDMIDETCELVNGAEVFIGEGNDSVHAYLFNAVKNNNETGILLLSDVFGFEDSATRDFAYRVACNGYNVLLPDLFRGDPWGKDKPESQYEQWRARQNPQRIANDIFASAKWMANEFLAAGISKKLGIIGFCFGGGRVIDILAQDQGTYFATGVSFYGTRIDSSVVDNIKVPILFIVGENDEQCSVNVLRDIEKKIKGSKVVVFKDRGHGFAHRPQTYEDDEDAEKGFTIMRNWLNDRLVLQN